MEATIGFALTVIWMGLGGWALAKFMSDPEVEGPGVAVLFWFCLLLAPFAFGMACAINHNSPLSHSKAK